MSDLKVSSVNSLNVKQENKIILLDNRSTRSKKRNVDAAELEKDFNNLSMEKKNFDSLSGVTVPFIGSPIGGGSSSSSVKESAVSSKIKEETIGSPSSFVISLSKEKSISIGNPNNKSIGSITVEKTKPVSVRASTSIEKNDKKDKLESTVTNGSIDTPSSNFKPFTPSKVTAPLPSTKINQNDFPSSNFKKFDQKETFALTSSSPIKKNIVPNSPVIYLGIEKENQKNLETLQSNQNLIKRTIKRIDKSLVNVSLKETTSSTRKIVRIKRKNDENN